MKVGGKPESRYVIPGPEPYLREVYELVKSKVNAQPRTKTFPREGAAKLPRRGEAEPCSGRKDR